MSTAEVALLVTTLPIMIVTVYPSSQDEGDVESLLQDRIDLDLQ